MKILFIFSGYIADDLAPSTEQLNAIHNCRLENDTLEPYLDFELADAGVIGGEIHGLVKNQQLFILVTFWAPPNFDQSLLPQLREDCVGQMEDGIGENGFDVKKNGMKLSIRVNTDIHAEMEMSDDGRVVPPASPIAIASRTGNIENLRAAIEGKAVSIETTLQGYSPLHYALLYGFPDAVRLLLNAGADPNKADPRGQSPLILCAMSNDLNDEQSLLTAQLLLDHGAGSKCMDPKRRTAKDWAILRKKPATAGIL